MPTDDSPITPPAPETTLWKGNPSQWVHFWYYFFCVLLAFGCIAIAIGTGGIAIVALIIPVILWLGRWWITKTTTYELTTQRLRLSSGILSRRVDELELYRVKDYTMEQPFFLRVANLGNLTLITSDVTTPTVVIRAISHVADVRENLRTAVQHERDRKRVRELDVDNNHGDEAKPL